MQLGSLTYAQDYKGRLVPAGFVVQANAIMAFKSDWPANLDFLAYATGGVATDDAKNFQKSLACPRLKRHVAVTEYDNLLRSSFGYNLQDPALLGASVIGTYIGPKTTDYGVADRITFIDSMGWLLVNTYQMNCYYRLADDSYRDGQGPGVSSAGVALRHSKKANMVFGDGRAGAYGFDSTWGKYNKTFNQWDNGIWNK
jgi:prepilin-type processing-associated H-X9-DG protein